MRNGNYFDHPILWSPDRKRFEERKVAEESLRNLKIKKEYCRLKALRDTAQYRKMIIEHNPWGKPGGGAPNNDVRMTNIVRKGLYPVGEDNNRNMHPQFRLKLARGGGGGAPIRSASGRMVTPFIDDPILGFNDPLRNYVDIELRYKSTPRKKKCYKMQLDKLIADKEKDRIRKKKMSIEVDKKLKLIKDPWGRPGPGGNPWRHPHSVGNKFLQSLGWTNSNDLQFLDKENSKKLEPITNKTNLDNSNQQNNNMNAKYNVNDKESYGNTNKLSKFQNKCCPKCTCVCLKEFLAKEKIEKVINSEPTKEKQSSGDIAKPPPKIKKSNTNIYLKHKSKNCIIEPKARPCMITGGVELVPLLAKRRAQQRSVSLSTTDVTRYKDGKGDLKEEDFSIQYLDELNRQINRKERDKRISRECDVAKSKQHFETWNTFWGRPGHGAPRPIKNKLNLDDLLYKVPLK